MKHSIESTPTRREFDKLAKSHTLIPVFRTVTADLETPVSAFLRIANEAAEAFLLESVEGGEHVGRYTFIGIEPYKKMFAQRTQHHGGRRSPPLELRRRHLRGAETRARRPQARAPARPAPLHRRRRRLLRLRRRPPDRAAASHRRR